MITINKINKIKLHFTVKAVLQINVYRFCSKYVNDNENDKNNKG